MSQPDDRLAAVRRWLGPDELFVLAGLVLVAIGGWLAWRPSAFLAPGLVLLWLGLPSRGRFVRGDAPAPTRRKES